MGKHTHILHCHFRQRAVDITGFQQPRIFCDRLEFFTEFLQLFVIFFQPCVFLLCNRLCRRCHAYNLRNADKVMFNLCLHFIICQNRKCNRRHNQSDSDNRIYRKADHKSCRQRNERRNMHTVAAGFHANHQADIVAK